MLVPIKIFIPLTLYSTNFAHINAQKLVHGKGFDVGGPNLTQFVSMLALISLAGKYHLLTRKRPHHCVISNMIVYEKLLLVCGIPLLPHDLSGVKTEKVPIIFVGLKKGAHASHTTKAFWPEMKNKFFC